MIRKKRDFPLRLKMEESLLRRLPHNHEKRPEILRNSRKSKAGYKGELELDFHLSFLPDEDFHIFQDLRLPIHGRFFQIDTLVLSPFFILIIESKNIYGTLYFDPRSKQLFRTFDGIKEGFPDPLMQVKRQQLQLQRWMKQFMVKTCPILYLVAIGHPGTIVETTPENGHIFEKVLHAEHIPDQVLDYSVSFPAQNLTAYQIRKLSDLLLSQHTPVTYDILEVYQISQDELIQGIPCAKCKGYPMKRLHAKWYCPLCNLTSSDAHVQTILDHLLLQRTLTNRECRKLLALDSSHTTKRILQSMNLPVKGSGKGRVYHYPFPKS